MALGETETSIVRAIEEVFVSAYFGESHFRRELALLGRELALLGAMRSFIKVVVASYM